MRDELNSRPDDERALGEALRALPLRAPERDLWADIARALPAQGKAPRRRWWPVGLAAAAGIAVAFLLWPIQQQVPERASPAAEDPRLAWIAESQALESTLRSLEGRPLDARSALAGAELEDLIGLTDLQLSVAEQPEESLALWQQRVLLMNELAEVRRTGRSRIAADNADMMPAAYRLN